MLRNVALIFVISLAFPIMGAWEFLATQFDTPTILPQDCSLQVNEELELSLHGFLPRNAVAIWDVDQGGISSVLPGLSAVLVAPSQATTVTVTVSVSPAIPGLGDTLTKQCEVVESGD